MGLKEEALPSSTAVQAAVRLISDEDTAVAQTCRSQLLRWGEASRPALEGAARENDARLRSRARSLLLSLDLHVWCEEMRSLAESAHNRTLDSDFLLRGLLLIAEFGRPGGVDEYAIRCTLDDWADDLLPRVRGRSSLTAARHLANQLSAIERFTGCREGYYRSENLLLDEVIRQRRGLPSALVALYLLVARRAGLEAHAVRLPEYFLVRIHGRRPVLLDPFHGGRSVTKADCLRYMRGPGGGAARSAQLVDVDDLDLLCGLLDDLQRAFSRSYEGEFRAALRRSRRYLSV